MEYIFTNLPQYIRVTPRTDFSSSVVQSNHVLLFSEDGTTLTAKLPDGSFITVGGSGGVDVSDTTAEAENVQSGYYFYNSAGVKTAGTLTVSGGVDVSDTTATAAMVLSGAMFHDSTGAVTTGTIPTVSASVTSGAVVVPSGYIANSQSFPVSSGTDVSSTTADASDVLSGKIFYNSGGIQTTGTIPTVSAAVSGGSVIVPSGYIASSQSFPVSSGGGSTDFYKCATVSGAVPEIKSPEDATGSTGTGYMISASSIFNSNYDGWKAFNGAAVDSDRGWFSEAGNSDPQWLQIQFTTAQVINYYSFNVGYDSASQHYSAWKLQGSNDGSTWADLDDVTGQDLSVYDSAYSSYLNNSTAYTYYRIYFAGTGGYPYIGLQNVKLGYLTSDKSWTGRQWNSSIWDFDSAVVSSGLTWSNMQPVVGGIYDAACVYRIGEIAGYVDGRVIYFPFTTDTDTTMGPSATLVSGTYTQATLQGITCLNADSVNLRLTYTLQMPLSVCFWAKPSSTGVKISLGGVDDTEGNFVLNVTDSMIQTFKHAVEMYISRSIDNSGSIAFYCVTLSAAGNAIWKNGVQLDSYTGNYGSFPGNLIDILIDGHITNLSVIAKVLSASEIETLYNELHPTAP